MTRRLSSIATTKTPALLCSLVLGCCVLSLVTYMYLLSSSVVHVVIRKEVQEEIRLTKSNIATLEASYINAKHQVSERIAEAGSLEVTTDKIFVTRVPATLVLEFANN